ncbi:winged helix-turn-helix domain-containing protein [Shigella sonnei]
MHLTWIEFRLLAVLSTTPEKCSPSASYSIQVWGPNAVEHSHYLRIYTGHLRQKLEGKIRLSPFY